MNSFSFNRFGKMLRWVLSVNFRTLLAWTVGSLVAVFVGEMLLVRMISPGTPDIVIGIYGQLGAVLLCLLSLIMVSTIVATINEKRKRETFLMLPASNLEKYLALLVYTSVVCVACIFMAAVLGDTLRMAWFWVNGPYNEVPSAVVDGSIVYWWSSAIPGLVGFYTPNVLVDYTHHAALYIAMQLVVGAGLILWLHSLMTLGGTLLRKYAFIITGAFFLIAGTLFGKLMRYFDFSMFTASWEDGGYVTQDVGTMAYVLAVALPLLAIFNYWASFRIFKGFDLITNKWMNYDFHK